MVAVYHSTEKGSVPFANIAWVGFVGSLTGYSSAGIGVSERLRGGAADTMTRFGKPWTYALRDVLQFSKTIDDALNNLNQTDRTCSVYLGIGSSVNNTYRIIEYAETEFRVYNDGNWKNDAAHPRKPGMIWKVELLSFRHIMMELIVSLVFSHLIMDSLQLRWCSERLQQRERLETRRLLLWISIITLFTVNILIQLHRLQDSKDRLLRLRWINSLAVFGDHVKFGYRIFYNVVIIDLMHFD